MNTYAGLYIIPMLSAATVRMVKILCGLYLGSRDLHKLLLLLPLLLLLVLLLLIQLLMINIIRIMLLITNAIPMLALLSSWNCHRKSSPGSCEAEHQTAGDFTMCYYFSA